MCESVCAFRKTFPHLLWLTSRTPPPPPLPLAPPPHTQTSPVRTSTLPRSGRPLCVLLTCLLSTGASNQTSRPPWITNAPTVGPQTAHCLSYGVFCLFLFWLHCHRGSLSKFWHLLVCAHVCVSVCIYGFTNVFFFFFFLQTLPKNTFYRCGWYSREPPPQTAEQDAEHCNYFCLYWLVFTVIHKSHTHTHTHYIRLFPHCPTREVL